MDFALAYLKSKDKFLLKSFAASPDEQKSDLGDKLIDWADIGAHSVQGLIFDEELQSDRELMAELEEEGRYLTIRNSADLKLPLGKFVQLDYLNARDILGKIQSASSIHSNLSLLEELFDTLEHLKRLYPDNRSAFFEELWFILKSNLATKTLRLIYNDVVKVGPEGEEKNKLIQVMVEGERRPESISGEKFARTLMAEYGKFFGSSNFEVVEYNSQAGQMSAVASIKSSPIILMAEVTSISRLQKATIKALFDGIQ